MKPFFPYSAILALLIFNNACDSTEPALSEANHVLMLKVDYTTNTFEGGKEFSFSKSSTSFEITNEYREPGDFGSVKLFYSGANEMLFYGEIIWMGSGKILYPTDWSPAEDFKKTPDKNLVYPANGFENVFDKDHLDKAYLPVWLSVQHVLKVRDYLQSNPAQTVKVFLYTPSVGAGNPEEWKWILFLNNWTEYSSDANVKAARNNAAPGKRPWE